MKLILQLNSRKCIVDFSHLEFLYFVCLFVCFSWADAQQSGFGSRPLHQGLVPCL